MNKYTLFLFFYVLGSSIAAQNLIPNPDFELGPDSTSVGWQNQTDSTCSIFGNVAGPDGWMLSRNTPDRLIEGDISCDWDRDTAQSGKAFIDFVYNEAGKTILLMPLEMDSVYRLSYYASWQAFGSSGFAPSRVRFNLNNGGNSFTSAPIMHQEWVYYDTVFVATGNSTELEIEGLDATPGGVNLDNLSLQPIDYTQLKDVANLRTPISIFPNPYQEALHVQTPLTGELDIILYDAAGRLVLQQKFTSTTTLHTAHLAKGFYIYKVGNEQGVLQTGKLVKQ